jgi:DNA-binding MarR family transcriptional regulator
MATLDLSLESATGSHGHEPVADALLSAIASVRRSVRRRTGAPVELASLTGSQLELVRLLRRRPGVSVAEAANELTLAANTVSTLVGQLIHAGLVVRRIDPSDRRIARLELDEEIRDKVAAWRDRRVVALAEAIGRLSPVDRRRLAEAVPVLERLFAEPDSAGAVQ